MNHPTVLLTDEPTSALDQEHGSQILDLIVRLTTEQNTATLLVTHDSQLLARASKAYAMVDGSFNEVAAVPVSMAGRAPSGLGSVTA